MKSPLQYDPAALDVACKDLGLNLVVAFGSRVSGKLPPREGSDLDLAILDTQPADGRRFFEVYERMSPIFPDYDLDLAFLTMADPLFRYEIFRTAERIHGDPNVFCEQKAFAYKAYIDSEDLRRLERRLFDKKMAFIASELDGTS